MHTFNLLLFECPPQDNAVVLITSFALPKWALIWATESGKPSPPESVYIFHFWKVKNQVQSINITLNYHKSPPNLLLSTTPWVLPITHQMVVCSKLMCTDITLNYHKSPYLLLSVTSQVLSLAKCGSKPTCSSI